MHTVELKQLTPSDYEILDALATVVEGIAASFGEHTEVALHSLDKDSAGIYRIANGHVTGRSPGAPITNLALMKLKEGKDVSDSYFARTETNRELKSTTTIVRNGAGDPIGLLCINVDLGAPIQSFLKAMVPMDCTLPGASGTPETFARNQEESVSSTVELVKTQVLSDDQITPSKRNREVVTRLHGLGIFNYKGSIPLTASLLDISKDTVYLYLRGLEKK
ncbi:transcriptional regulator [Ferrimonas sp. SCSIO 43195]|uniref:helix-turn-helix transcriptional regulator n=1 Tax=Ferrimonas sp. SCSIO 43195 TaxID=2822844 RepID=UPI002075CEED|nr:PAS domain-containing protein [Ferrimonas sp. SCSIO 43195]